MDKTKRAKWTVDEMVLSVRYATAHHDKFVVSIFSGHYYGTTGPIGSTGSLDRSTEANELDSFTSWN